MLVDPNYDKDNQNRLKYNEDELNSMISWIDNQKKL
jgi:hypothetical protein